ncbi:MAG: enoyl-CoA hydratase-related protein [Steroidobacteraceae bacterium]
MSEPLLLEKSGPLATLTFNQPEKANALDPAWLPRMTQFLQEVEHDQSIRCVLIKGNGKHFMAGGSLEYMDRFMSSPPAQRAILAEGPIHEYNKMVYVMRRMQKPIVASVQGAVAGAAVGLVAACDLAIAADNAFFFVAHILHGGSNDGLLSYFLPRQIGARKTLELALLGDRVAAAEAHRLGLVNFVVPAAALQEETQKLVNRLASGPTRGYGLIKRLVDASAGNSLEEQGRLEAESYGKAAMTDDLVEGIRAFMAKRPPKFEGK